MPTPNDFLAYGSHCEANDNTMTSSEAWSPAPVYIADGSWEMPELGSILMAFNTWTKNFDQDVTGFKAAETRVNLHRLRSDLLRSIQFPKEELNYPRVGTFRHMLLVNRKEYREAMCLAKNCLEVAERLRPDLVEDDDEPALIDVARSYRDHVTATNGGSGRTVKFAFVLVPSSGSKPTVIIASNDDLPDVFAHHQHLTAN